MENPMENRICCQMVDTGALSIFVSIFGSGGPPQNGGDHSA